jgi:hypothetical protein
MEVEKMIRISIMSDRKNNFKIYWAEEGKDYEYLCIWDREKYATPYVIPMMRKEGKAWAISLSKLYSPYAERMDKKEFIRRMRATLAYKINLNVFNKLPDKTVVHTEKNGELKESGKSNSLGMWADWRTYTLKKPRVRYKRTRDANGKLIHIVDASGNKEPKDIAFIDTEHKEIAHKWDKHCKDCDNRVYCMLPCYLEDREEEMKLVREAIARPKTNGPEQDWATIADALLKGKRVDYYKVIKKGGHHLENNSSQSIQGSV